MPFIKELWNNITSFYKNWHKKIKWFSIFIKPNKCQKNRKEKQIRRKTYLALTSLCNPFLCGLAGPVGQPSPPGLLLCRLPPPRPSSCVPAPQPAAATRPTTSCFPPHRSGLPGRRHDALHLSPSLSFLPLPWFSLSQPPEHARRRRSP